MASLAVCQVRNAESRKQASCEDQRGCVETRIPAPQFQFHLKSEGAQSRILTPRYQVPRASRFSVSCSHQGSFQHWQSQNIMRQRFSHPLETSELQSRGFIEARKAAGAQQSDPRPQLSMLLQSATEGPQPPLILASCALPPPEPAAPHSAVKTPSCSTLLVCCPGLEGGSSEGGSL